MNFASDNTAPVAPAILDALAEASRGYARGYGNDDWTRAAERKFCEIFERDVATFLVPTGTAANALALAQVSPPWGAIFCHAESHIHTDECGRPNFSETGSSWSTWPARPARSPPMVYRRRSPAMAGIVRIRLFQRRSRLHRRLKPAPSTEPTRSPHSRKSRGSGRSRCTWMAPALPMRWSGSMPRPP